MSADEPEVDVTFEQSFVLSDGDCWVAGPDELHPESGYVGVLAVQMRDGAVFILLADGESRVWQNIETKQKAKAVSIKSVN